MNVYPDIRVCDIVRREIIKQQLMTNQQKPTINLVNDLVNDPLAYGKKYNKPYVAIAYEHALTTSLIYLYESKKRKPSAQTRRISQLLDCLRQHNIEPPEPIWE